MLFQFVYRETFQRLVKQHRAKILSAVLSNFRLLPRITMILERQNHGEVRRLESCVCYRFDNVLQARKKRTGCQDVNRNSHHEVISA